MPLIAYERGTIDTVISWHWGEGQNAGQEEKYFPSNIFGCPDTAARKNLPSSSPEDICSLGFGGEITVAFKDYEIVDGPGADFTIFENAFINPVTNRIFAEPAVVSVSRNGINFIEFPFDTLTLKGCAGITPTNGDKDCFNPAESGGDYFDLAVLGLESVRYVKIRDISKMLLDNLNHPYYDPIITGFDLDAVCGLNLNKLQVSVAGANSNRKVQILTSNGVLSVYTSAEGAKIKIYDLLGRLIENSFMNGKKQFQKLRSGLYFIMIEQNGKLLFKGKIVL
jgi:hypothetical protein